MTSPLADRDTGLLSPVRAGTPVERAVSDDAWIQAMLDAEAALARAQARLGTVPQEAADVITAAARTARLSARDIAVASRQSANPVVALVQSFTGVVGTADPAAAEYVHRGSTSQDIFDTAAMLVSARALRLVREDLRRVIEALGDLAWHHRDTTMAGRTLALHAVPTTFGLKVAGWRGLIVDADRRLADLLMRGLPVSLGGAAGTLSAYAEYALIDGGVQEADAPAYLDRLTNAFAEETGLCRPALPWHALRAPVVDLGHALAFTAGGLGKVAADVLSLARTEVAEVGEPSAAGRGVSSAMPHKQNPVLATLIRSVALQVPALASVVGHCMPAEDERSAGLWHAEWQPLREMLRLVGGAAHTAAELAEGLEVYPAQMRANLQLTQGQLVSERVSARLAPLMGKATAKKVLTEASTAAREARMELHEALAAVPEVAGHFSDEELKALCDPESYTGAASFLVDRALRPDRRQDADT